LENIDYTYNTKNVIVEMKRHWLNFFFLNFV
jgi:hypothetical protein